MWKCMCNFQNLKVYIRFLNMKVHIQISISESEFLSLKMYVQSIDDSVKVHSIWITICIRNQIELCCYFGISNQTSVSRPIFLLKNLAERTNAGAGYRHWNNEFMKQLRVTFPLSILLLHCSFLNTQGFMYDARFWNVPYSDYSKCFH